ncbi:MAG: CHAD domain-containing protein [Mycobacteriaceae bacterium]|nr:CHAD domain-containing protein [Mycobacteriaceae bacterium]
MTQTWLDTFDWRLHATGITLEYVDQGPLTGHFPDGAQLHGALPQRTWPVQVEDLPAGPLRDALAPIIVPRALLQVVTVHRTSREGRILNADEKTVARLVMESDEHGTTRLLVLPLRGYAPQAEWIAVRLAGTDGFTAITTTPYAEALASASRHPDNYDKSPTVPLHPDTPAAVAIATVLQHFQTAITDNLAGTIDDLDIEFLHDLRVAVRRTRSILKLTGEVLPADTAVRFAPEFKWLGDLTTPVRDLDVYLLGFDAMVSGLASAEPAELEEFRSFLLQERKVERRSLVRGLQSRRFLRLMDEWSVALAEAADSSAVGAGGLTIAGLARQRVGRVLKRVARQGEHITNDSPGEQVHELRKRCKELRYLLEVFRPLCAVAPHRALVKHLKAVQDTLGDFQDGEVQRNAVRQFAATMMNAGVASSETLLAMGELAAQLDAQQSRARELLPDRLLPFVAEAHQTRVKTLVLR